jgi:hypothetical protein
MPSHRLHAIGLALIAIIGAAGAPAPAHAQAPATAREIMRRVLLDSRADDEVVRVAMRLVDSSGRVRRRAATFYSRKTGTGESLRLFRFHEPPELARSGILSIEHRDRDADQWIYLPAYHASRRIAPANRANAWMGTDFTYEDITDPKLGHYEYATRGRERVDGTECTIIEAVPTSPALVEESGYSRTVYWVDVAESVAPKIEYYDRSGRLRKILRNAGLQRHGKYRRWGTSAMHDVTRDHRTILDFARREIDQGLSEDHFRVSNLERGR